MSTRYLYRLAVPSDTQNAARSQGQSNVATQGVLGPGVPVVESTSNEPGTHQLQTEYRNKYVKGMATELEELFQSDIATVPFTVATGSHPNDGYYELRSVDVTPRDPRVADGPIQVNGTMTKVGTRKSHWRAVHVEPETFTNPFGTTSTNEIGIPSNATKVQWFDDNDGTIAAASVLRTEAGEVQDVDIYDVSTQTMTRQYLLFELPYAEEGKADPMVWDDNGNASKTDANGDVQWDTVFHTSHEFDGQALIGNGILRLTFDEANQSLTAERWDDVNTTYSSVTLGTSDWVLFDLDLTSVGMSRVEAQVEFYDTVNDVFYSINLALRRGFNDGLWRQAPNAGAIPSGLQTKLDPIAEDTDTDPLESQVVKRRSEVRR